MTFNNLVDVNNTKYEDIFTGAFHSFATKYFNKRVNGTEKPPLSRNRTKRIETVFGGDSLTNINQPVKCEN